MDQYFKETTFGSAAVLAQLTGQSYLSFERNSKEVMARIVTFLAYYAINNFPNVESKQSLYHSISASLYNLSLNSKWYDKWVLDPIVSNNVHSFMELESSIFPTSPDNATDTSSEQDQLFSELTQESQQAEQAWSDNGEATPQVLSPEPISRQVISPEQFDDNPQPMENPKTGINALFDQIRQRRDDTHVIDSIPVLESVSLTDNVVESPIIETQSEIDLDDNENFILTQAVEEIVTTPDEMPRLGFSALFDEIRARRDNSNVIEDIVTPDSSSNHDLFDENRIRRVDTLREDYAPYVGEHIDYEKIRIDISDSIVKLELGETWRLCRKITFMTTDNYQWDYELPHDLPNTFENKFHRLETIDLKSVMQWGNLGHTPQISSIHVLDYADNFHPIYELNKSSD